MQRAYAHRSSAGRAQSPSAQRPWRSGGGSSGYSRGSSSTFRPRMQYSGSGGSSGHYNYGWRPKTHGYWPRHQYYLTDSVWYPTYDNSLWLGSYGYDALSPSILYPALYGPNAITTTSYIVQEKEQPVVENVGISTDPNNSISAWNAQPNTAIHYGPTDKPTFLFCSKSLKPTRVVADATGSASRPILQIDNAKYQCK